MSRSKYIDIHTHRLPPDGYNTLAIENIRVDLNCKMASLPTDGSRLFSVGVHPWDISELSEEDLKNGISQMESLILSHSSVVAVGEIGVDRSIETPIADQLIYYREQQKLAAKCQIPVIVHSVRANEIAISKKTTHSEAVVIHGFRGGKTEMEQLISHNIYLSFGAYILSLELDNIRDLKLIDTIRSVPVGHLFLETDESDSTIQEIYHKVAEIRECSVTQLRDDIYRNFREIFDQE